MKKTSSCLIIALFSLSLFSCKNEKGWTPEAEAEFKKAAIEEMTKPGEDQVSNEQATFTIDCMVEKFKQKSITPEGTEKDENEAALMEIATSCATEWLSKK